jgi:hypothetical protein
MQILLYPNTEGLTIKRNDLITRLESIFSTLAFILLEVNPISADIDLKDMREFFENKYIIFKSTSSNRYSKSSDDLLTVESVVY